MSDDKPRWMTKLGLEDIAEALDVTLNGIEAVRYGRGEKKTGFVLFLYPFGDTSGRTNYVSNNAGREEVTKMLEEQLRFFRDDDAQRH